MRIKLGRLQLEASRIGKYDMAIIHGSGYSVVAARELLASLPAEMPKYGLHDGDLDGYVIERTLGEATQRMPDHFVPIIDLGLTVQQVLDWNESHDAAHQLRIERVVRETGLPKCLELNEIELEWFGNSCPIPQPDGETH